MLTLTIWKFVKYIGLSLYAAGLYNAFAGASTRERSFAAHWVGAAGLLLLWVAGYGMMKTMGHSLRTVWILVPMLASLVAFGAALASVGATKLRPWLGVAGVAGFAISLIAMVFRTQPHDILLVTLVPVLCAGIYLALKRRADHQTADEAAAQATSLRWFLWLSRFEGLSLLVLLGVYVPLKYGAKIVLDGGQGWFGWVHGLLQLFYIAALVVTARRCGWSIGRGLLGFVASVVPFGPFVFERYLPLSNDQTD